MPPRKRETPSKAANGPNKRPRQQLSHDANDTDARKQRRRSKRNPKTSTTPGEFDKNDTSHSILGGTNGGFRVTSDEKYEDGVLGFKVPFRDKGIVCQLYQTPKAESERTHELIFTHGAGGGLANPAMADFAKGFAEKEQVLCFQGTMNLQSRVKTFDAVVEHVRSSESFESEAKSGKQTSRANQRGQGLALGGRSMGARAACMAAQQLEHVDTLVLVSYPMMSGKGESREQLLYEIPKTTRVLFVVGDRDKMCNLEKLDEVRGKMGAKVRSQSVPMHLPLKQ